MTIGLMRGTVTLADYDPQWAELFKHEATLLQQVLGVKSKTIHHVGSTAIPGMVAKPIIDIAISVDSLDVAEAWKNKLASVGYWYKGVQPDMLDRRFFAKGSDAKRTIYLHLVNQHELERLLRFKRTLIDDPKAAAAYATLKTALAKASPDDRATYTSAKNDFIQSILIREHPYMQRYRAVWEQTLAQKDLPLEQIKKSRYYFNDDLSTPTPKEFARSTYGIAALLPMPNDIQQRFKEVWQHIMDALDHPLAYAVEPQNRHVELLVFTRPEEEVDEEIVKRNIKTTFTYMQAHPPRAFSITYCRPFVTPDGTVVMPGFPTPQTAVEDFRAEVRHITNDSLPQKQSQWFHTPLGRILEPLDAERLKKLYEGVDAHWGEVVLSTTIDKLLWTSEQQWYMVKKQILHELNLS